MGLGDDTMTRISAISLLLIASAALAADVAPVEQRLALQIAGLTLQTATLGRDLDLCKASLAEAQKK